MASNVTSSLRRRFWFEIGLGAFSAVLALVTVVWHDWIEIVLRVDPDHSSGSLEWVIVAVAAAAAATAAALARAEWNRSSAVA